MGVTPFRVLITLLYNLLTKSPAPPSMLSTETEKAKP